MLTGRKNAQIHADAIHLRSSPYVGIIRIRSTGRNVDSFPLSLCTSSPCIQFKCIIAQYLWQVKALLENAFKFNLECEKWNVELWYRLRRCYFDIFKKIIRRVKIVRLY